MGRFVVKRARARSGVFGACEVCGTAVYSYPSRIRRFCGLACRDVAALAQRINAAERTKKCARCDQWKPFDMFAAARGRKAAGHGMQAYCTPCASSTAKEWAERNPKRRKEINKKSRDAAPKRPITDERRKRQNESAKRNRKLPWNAEKKRIYNRLRAHRQRVAGPVPHRYDIGRMFCMQDARCPYCGDFLSKYHIDHKTPITRGGTNDIENLHLTCPTCNMRKGTMTHEEFIHGDKSAMRLRKLDEMDLLAATIEALAR